VVSVPALALVPAPTGVRAATARSDPVKSDVTRRAPRSEFVNRSGTSLAHQRIQTADMSRPSRGRKRGRRPSRGARDRRSPRPRRYHPFHATRADLLRRLHRPDEAVTAYELAASLAPTPAERQPLRPRPPPVQPVTTRHRERVHTHHRSRSRTRDREPEEMPAGGRHVRHAARDLGERSSYVGRHYRLPVLVSAHGRYRSRVSPVTVLDRGVTLDGRSKRIDTARAGGL
jgi:hypothetical protein